MFKNRSVRIKLERDPITSTDGFYDPVDLDHIQKVTKEIVTHTVVTIGMVYAGQRLVKTICHITEMCVKSALR